jgi:CysZ protein
MILNIFKGFTYPLKGLRIIAKPEIRRFVIIPLSINIVLFTIAILLLFNMFDQWMQSLLPDFPSWLSWLEDWIIWIIWPLFASMILFVVFYSFTFIANLIAAPFNSLLSEKVELMLKNQPLNQTPSYPSITTIKQTLTSEASKLVYLLQWSIVILIVSLIPVINIIAPVLWFVFGAWMLALEYIDYPMSNHGYYFKDINRQANSEKALSFGYGCGALLLTSIPILNFLAMPAAVAGATALCITQGDQI